MRRQRRDREPRLRREPPLDELLHDPAAQLLMRRDGVDEATLRQLLARIGEHIAAPPQPAA